MLDDLKLIHERDADDALGVADKQWHQLQQDYQVSLPEFSGIANVVLAGMGGSALPAVFLRSWPGTLVPFEVVRDDALPAYVGKDTLFISSSYSGNTEETLTALAEAETRGAQIVVIAAGGKLAEHARTKQYPLFTVPGGIQPRMCSFYFLAAFTQLLYGLHLWVNLCQHHDSDKMCRAVKQVLEHRYTQEPTRLLYGITHNPAVSVWLVLKPSLLTDRDVVLTQGHHYPPSMKDMAQCLAGSESEGAVCRQTAGRFATISGSVLFRQQIRPMRLL